MTLGHPPRTFLPLSRHLGCRLLSEALSPARTGASSPLVRPPASQPLSPPPGGLSDNMESSGPVGAQWTAAHHEACGWPGPNIRGGSTQGEVAGRRGWVTLARGSRSRQGSRGRHASGEESAAGAPGTHFPRLLLSAFCSLMTTGNCTQGGKLAFIWSSGNPRFHLREWE